MRHRQSGFEPLLLGLCSLLFASCRAPATPVIPNSQPEIAVAPAQAHLLAEVYAERLRLGLGSPYRLIEVAMRDERLGNARGAVARMLLQQVERGTLYEITPHALVASGAPEANAIAQLELIRQAIESAGDPRVGELAVNLAYELAAAEGAVPDPMVGRVARVAALLRDRELARADAQHLRATANQRAMAPEHLVLVWRAERRFAVEQPTLAPLDAAAQDEAARLALLLAGGIRAAVTPVSSVMQRTIADAYRGLAPAAAALPATASPRPSDAALLVALRTLRSGATDERARVHAPHWQQFFATATDEERFVVALALARHGSADDVVAAGVALDVAIALRPFAQEAISITPVSAQELAARFGVRVRFDPEVTMVQRTHALHVLGSALADMRTVVRSFDVAGLTFDVGAIEPTASHLAFHDPRKRVIRLDPSTMAGTIAHELAHDLDWQLASRKYKTRSSYATDYATKNRRALAYTVESLVATAAPMNSPAEPEVAGRRPAEIFARRFEWYVASALALRGRSSGYLSSAQNDWIAGYGSAVRPDPAPAAAKSFAALVAEATSMDRTDRAAIEATVIESAPVAVRVLARAGMVEDRAQFERQSTAELRQWECNGTWHGMQREGTATRWFVDALTAAAFPPTVAATASGVSWNGVKLQPVRTAAAGNPLSFRFGGCNPLGGVVLAESIR